MRAKQDSIEKICYSEALRALRLSALLEPDALDRSFGTQRRSLEAEGTFFEELGLRLVIQADGERKG
jgi:hypothetical protein